MRETIYKCVLRAAGRKRYKFFRETKHIPHLPPEEIARVQLSKLQRILTHAAQNVPYYRKLFEEAGFEPESLTSVEQLREIPTLKKDTVRTQTDKLVAANYPKDELFRLSTGGSTGIPLSFYKDIDCYEREMAYMWRCWGHGGYSTRDRMVWIWGAPDVTSQMQSLKGRVKWRLGGKLLLNAFEMGDEDMARWVREINSFRPVHIFAYPSALMRFARHILANGIKLNTRFKQVITSAEKVLPHQRELFREAFDAPVYDQYAGCEVRLVAFECSKGNMHVNTDAAVVEFLDDPSVPGNVKKIVITSLDNYGMPLIRYEMGDYGVPLEDRCDCGINFPLMGVEIGRIFGNFVSPEGKIIHGHFFNSRMYGAKGVKNFQFHQKEPGVVHLYIVLDSPSERASVEKHLEGVREDVRNISPGIELRVEFADKIDTTRSGKHRFTVCDLIED